MPLLSPQPQAASPLGLGRQSLVSLIAKCRNECAPGYAACPRLCWQIPLGLARSTGLALTQRTTC